MDPSLRPYKRRATSGQSSNSADPPISTAAMASPSPFTSNPNLQGGVETRRPRSGQTVSIGWDETEEPIPRRTSRLQVELAECVETKTVTTTTTTKRSYPPILLHHQPLEALDTKEYPLALNPTPPELTHFSYEVEGQLVNFREGNSMTRETLHSEPQRKTHSRFSMDSEVEVKQEELTGKDLIYHTDKVEDMPFLDSERQPESKQPSHDRRTSSRGDLKTRRKFTMSGKEAGHKKFGKEKRSRHGLGMLMSDNTPFPVTPDTSELELGASSHTRRAARPFHDACTPQSRYSQNDPFDNVPSPSENNSQDFFASAVATPPIADSDLETFNSVNEAFANASNHRPPLNIAAAQNASLPSPGLSPTYNGSFGDDASTEDDELSSRFGAQSGDSQDLIERACVSKAQLLQGLEDTRRQNGNPFALSEMLETFDSMPSEMKTVMMFHLLKRCPRKTLHMIADTVNPALKCNFLDQLPTELSLNILSFLDHRDLCRAAQVSKQWRSVVDSNETGWKELLDKDGFVLPAGELERAIKQGWGWQDPHGPDGFEQDLGVQHGPQPYDGDHMVAGSSRVETEAVRKVRSTTKRKRVAGAITSDRAKRRAVSHEFLDKAKGSLAKYPHSAEYHKSEGPLTAASAAALAVPDPQLGLASMRKLHLFKSLYRRRYVLRQSWTSGEVQPHHFAFPAHPSHVITCLQFDDDKILTGSDDTLIHVYDTRTGVLRKKLEGHEGGVWALQYEGNVLVSGSTDRSVRVWDIEKGLCTQVFHGHTSTVRCLQILMPEHTGAFEKNKPVMMPEKPLIITGSRDSQLRVWRLPEQGSKRYIQTGPPANDADCPYFVRVLTGHGNSVRAIAAHQDTLVSGSYDNTVRVWKISTGETLHRLAGHAMKVYSVVLDHKRNRCISGSMDNFVKIWDLTTGACLYTLEGHTSLVGLLDLRDERLVSAAADSTLRIWDPETGQCKSTLTAHTGAITCFQHDGQKVISGSDRTLKMWDVKTGECIKDLLTDLTGVWQVKFDERRCVAAVQRDNLTFVEVLDFGASRDGIPAEKRGYRSLLRPEDEGRITEEEDA